MRRLSRSCRSAAAAAAALLIAACAQPGMPPGGPEDRNVPEVLAVSPESGSVGGVPPRVTFQFDEVVNERPQGVTAIDQLFLVSPRDGAPRVEWKRRRIEVRPRGPFRPNTVYTVTMLPGLADLRGNVRRTGAVAVFSTGAPIPSTRLSGTVFDWLTGNPARALVEAVTTDSTVYVTVTDTAGRFTLDHLPSGVYLLRATIDANNNRIADPREPFDTTRITLVDLARVQLATFPHDTLGPRISTVTIADSLTLRVLFDKPLDVTQEIDSASFQLLGADSARVPVAAAVTARRLAARRDSARADSVRAAGDTAARRDTIRRAPAVPLPQRPRTDTTPPAPTLSRPLPETEAVVTLAAPLRPGSAYRLRAIDIRNLLGRARTSERVFQTPRARADTAAARDTVARPPGRPRP